MAKRTATIDKEANLTFAEIAQRLRVSDVSVWRWVNIGISVGGVVEKLHAFKAGGRYRVTEADLDDFLRRINPDTWQQVALAQEKKRWEAKRDRERLHRSLGEK